jgi:hypothetical protein
VALAGQDLTAPIPLGKRDLQCATGLPRLLNHGCFTTFDGSASLCHFKACDQEIIGGPSLS